MADNGYFPQLDKAVEQFPNTDFYIDDKNRRKDYINFYELRKRYSTPKFNNLIKLVSPPDGAREYKKRMHTVEPPIGDFKFNLGYRYFVLRGLEKVKGVFNLMCIGHNLKKIFRFLTKKGIDIAKALKRVKENGSEMEKIKKMLGLSIAC